MKKVEVFLYPEDGKPATKNFFSQNFYLGDVNQLKVERFLSDYDISKVICQLHPLLESFYDSDEKEKALEALDTWSTFVFLPDNYKELIEEEL